MLNFILNNEEETKIKNYQEMLIDHQKETNLISNNTVNNIWERHIIDSAQLHPLINSNKEKASLKIADLGTGAGLPGVVLAILNKKNNYFLIESNGKKTKFLDKVKKEIQLDNVEILNIRIEDLILKQEKFNIILSRALCKLDKLYDYSKELLNNNGVGLFLKGKTYQEELTNLLKKHKNLEDKITLIQSITNEESKIIKIKFDKNYSKTKK